MEFKCDMCNKEFKNNYDYTRHINRKRSCIKQVYCCDKCGYNTNDKTKYNRHMNKKTECLTLTTVRQSLIEEIKKEYEKKIDKIKKTSSNKYREYVMLKYDEAYNIEDCLNHHNITRKLIDECKQLLIKDGVVHILKELCNKEQQLRPFHCLDSSRLNYLLRTGNTWVMDLGASQIGGYVVRVVNDVYNTVYGEKMKEIQEQDITQENLNARIAANYAISEEMRDLSTDSVDKKCMMGLKKTVNMFTIKDGKLDATTNL